MNLPLSVIPYEPFQWQKIASLLPSTSIYCTETFASLCGRAMARIAEQKQITYLPPELWQQIFLQHTDPNHLWTVGRRVCSAWRSEIPKIFAKKYLEDPDMVQIDFDLGATKTDNGVCWIGVEMVFDRCKGETKKRCVFAQHPSKRGNGMWDTPGLGEKSRRTKSRVWGEGLAKYLGGNSGAREDCGRFDLPPYQIRIEGRAWDSELPNLEFDAGKMEMSFEWEGVFSRCFLELRAVAVAQLEIMNESMRWREDAGGGIISNTLAHTKKRAKAFLSAAKSVCRHRIKKYYRGKCSWAYEDDRFEEEAEDKAFKAIQDREVRGNFARCAEHTESREKAETQEKCHDVLGDVEKIREWTGVREDDEDGIMAILMEVLSPGDATCEDAQDAQSYDDFYDEDYGEDDDDDVSEEERNVDDEWMTPNEYTIWWMLNLQSHPTRLKPHEPSKKRLIAPMSKSQQATLDLSN